MQIMMIEYKSEPLLSTMRYCSIVTIVIVYLECSIKCLSREMLSIVGHNGAGKSTLAKAIWIFRYNR